jgi:hypothetical protein
VSRRKEATSTADKSDGSRHCLCRAANDKCVLDFSYYAETAETGTNNDDMDTTVGFGRHFSVVLTRLLGESRCSAYTCRVPRELTHDPISVHAELERQINT